MLTFGDGVDAWRAEVARATNLMARRGPDSDGLWSDGSHCLFGFRRLAVLDVSAAAHQPMCTPCGRYALVYNGELYNFRELRRSLEGRGIQFRSTGDAEVVLHALAEFGVEALEQFNGMFALGFYDAREKRLLLARDHAAIKPLYLLRHQDGLLFGSQYDQIVSHPWAAGRSVNDAALSLYLNLGYIPPPYALMAGSEALSGGSWMTVDVAGREEHGRHFTFPRQPEPTLRGAEAYDAVDAAIKGAVRRQMVSDVPVGVFLSGGIDSPLVAAMMREATNATIPAFTIGTNGDEFDESPDARRYAAAIGLDLEVRHVGSMDVLAMIDDVVDARQEPHDDSSIFPMLVASHLAREKVTVVLSGDGGDDLFWGYPARMIAPLRQVEEYGVKARVQQWITGRGSRGRAVDGALGVAHFRRQRFVSENHLTSVFPDLPTLPPDFTLFDFHGEGRRALAQWTRWNEFSGHLGGVLQKVDRGSMHASLEVRVPLLDREVVSVAALVDWQSCMDIDSGVGKLPLREALRRRVPFQTVAKRGFEVPMGQWLRSTLRPLFEDLVLARQELLGLPMDRAALATVFHEHVTHASDATYFLWRLLSLALWEARYFRGRHA